VGTEDFEGEGNKGQLVHSIREKFGNEVTMEKKHPLSDD